jgi:hypothetical protein
MTSLMGRNNVQARRKAESNAANKRVRESHTGQVDVRVAPQERAHLVVGRKELRDRIAKRRLAPRSNTLWRRSMARRPLRQRTLGRWLHRVQVHTVRDR